mmetsp:Transcript_35386/g.45633  ORF Transcript_35386/g.45633 Transcript_35386/m.45633 type:complete len:155 (-) Transcript_35386:1236-1700(-)
MESVRDFGDPGFQWTLGEPGEPPLPGGVIDLIADKLDEVTTLNTQDHTQHTHRPHSTHSSSLSTNDRCFRFADSMWMGLRETLKLGHTQKERKEKVLMGEDVLLSPKQLERSVTLSDQHTAFSPSQHFVTIRKKKPESDHPSLLRPQRMVRSTF